MTAQFRLVALPGERFAPLFLQCDTTLAEQGIRRVTADQTTGFPCRVSLADAEPGEQLLLLPFIHQPAATPYRASGPIFVRRGAIQAVPDIGEVPDSIRRRFLSVRGYDGGHMIVAADLSDGGDLEPVVGRLFANPRVDYLHVHYAKPGCFACRIERA